MTKFKLNPKKISVIRSEREYDFLYERYSELLLNENRTRGEDKEFNNLKMAIHNYEILINV